VILDHVQLAMPVGGEEQARIFYARLLGMTEEPKPESLKGRGGCWFRSAGCHVHLGVDPEFRPQRKAHPAFIVEDVADLAERLAASGFQVIWDDLLPDQKRFYTHDPFGNRLEFIRTSDGFGQR
jgi:catechol 2,3-dioxygenase-like lactoylglutathione lyase family enzyme